MPRITIKVGTAERYRPTVLRGTPLGALPTEAVLEIGAFAIEGSSRAFRQLAEALEEAADLADRAAADDGNGG
jgi:hypothetical protein